MSRPAAFRQADLTRALKGARAAGLDVTRFEIEPGGKIVVLAAGAGHAVNDDGPNEWDEVLHHDQAQPAPPAR